MPLTLIQHHGSRPVGFVVGETLVGTSLVLLGGWLVYMAFTTPIVVALAMGGRTGTAGPAVIVLAWAALLAAPLGLVLLGTDRLTRLLGVLRAGMRRPPAYIAALPDDIAVVRGVMLDDGRPAPMLLVGSFGTAVVHEGEGTVRQARRRADDASDVQTSQREATIRDAERVRHWLGEREVDFIVRVYAAILTTDRTLARTPACAVVPPDQLSAWVASLPRQRSLTADRRDRIVRLLADAT